MSTIIESKEFWEQHIEKFKASGASQVQYCRDNKLNYPRFSYWFRKQSPNSPSVFVPIKIKPTEIAALHEPLCTLEFRGHLLKIHALSALSMILDRMA